jgi:hypothetical protein
MDRTAPVCQKFTAIGKVKDSLAYQVELGDGFNPYRRAIEYFSEAKELDIRPLIDSLPFIKNKARWGMTFRFGFMEIDPESFRLIALGMLGADPTTTINAASAAAAPVPAASVVTD